MTQVQSSKCMGVIKLTVNHTMTKGNDTMSVTNEKGVIN